MFKLNLAAIRALAIKVSFSALAVAGVIAFASSATAEPKDLFATDAVAGSVLAFGTDGTATTFASGLTDPQGIALDQDANVYVSEGSVGDLLMFTPDGTMSVLTSGLSNPLGVAFVGVSAGDNFDILVAENGADSITKVTPTGTKIPFITVTAPVAVAVGVGNGNIFVTHETFVSTYDSNGIQIGTPVDVGNNTRAVTVLDPAGVEIHRLGPCRRYQARRFAPYASGGIGVQPTRDEEFEYSTARTVAAQLNGIERL